MPSLRKRIPSVIRVSRWSSTTRMRKGRFLLLIDATTAKSLFPVLSAARTLAALCW
jgi:hypothetical protein